MRAATASAPPGCPMFLKCFDRRNGPNAIVAWLAFPFALLLLGAGVVGALHHHAGGAIDTACAVCSASTASATTVPVDAAPLGPELRPEALVLPAESRPAFLAVRRASSRAPPTA